MTPFYEQLPIELRAPLMKAAEVDADIMDMRTYSEDVSDDVMLKAHDIVDRLGERFETLVKNVPEDLKRIATEFIYARYDEIQKERAVRAKQGLRKQHSLRLSRERMDRARARGRKKAAIA